MVYHNEDGSITSNAAPRTLFGGNTIIATKDAEIARLTAERDTARAETAMAFDVAASHYENGFPAWDVFGQFIRECRALTPAHATAALESKLRAEREQALRDAAAVCDKTDRFLVGYHATPSSP